MTSWAYLTGSLSFILALAGCAGAPPPTSGVSPRLAAAGDSDRSRRSCGTVHESLLAQGPVFPFCDVDEKPRLIGTPARVGFEPSTRGGCFEASFEMVLDERGHPVPELVRLVRTNNPQFASAVRAALLSERYTPAKRGGVAVRVAMPGARALTSAVVSSRGGAPPAPPGRFRGC